MKKFKKLKVKIGEEVEGVKRTVQRVEIVKGLKVKGEKSLQGSR